MIRTKSERKKTTGQGYAEALLPLLEHRCKSEGPHFLRIQIIVETILRCLMKKTDKYKLTEEEKQLICIASSLHDVGKAAIPSEILDKPGKLDPEEYEIIKTHTLMGVQILKSFPSEGDGRLLYYSYQICRWHHERYDGHGYPDGLSGEDIPISAQVAGLADAYDALTSKRPYKEAFSHHQAIAMIETGACGAFAPLLLECLAECADELQRQMADLRTNLNYEEKCRDTVEKIEWMLQPNRAKPQIRFLIHKKNTPRCLGVQYVHT
jgi:HD-GYP domain-containing protein (c-di-GMP phosphodiesterase class II)